MFDEPACALDAEMISGVLEVMAELTEAGMTIVCIPHEKGFAKRITDIVIIMDHGDIVEVAPPNVFYFNPKS